MEDRFSLRRFGWAVLAFCGMLGIGTIGFHELTTEGWVASLYRSVVTTTLTGIDAQPPGEGAQLFTIFLLLGGVAIFLYLAGVIVEIIARGVLTGAWAERRRRRLIEELRDHVIICGFGRVGRRAAHEFRDAGADYVVLDFNEESIEHAKEHGDVFIEGSGTSDEDLEAAGLSRARGLVAASDSDVDNLYITLSARSARPDLLIVSRASTEDAAKKLLRAGADRVVQPYTTAGEEMAKLMLKPQVAAFLDMVGSHTGPDLSFEEIEVTTGCQGANRTLRDLDMPEGGALIVAVRKPDGSFETTPEPDLRLDPGDVLIAMGTEPELLRLEELFTPARAVAG